MAKLVKEDVIAGLKEMNMVEIMDLVKAIEEEFGVKAAAAAAPAASAAKAAEGPSEVSVILKSFGTAKVAVIKAVQAITASALWMPRSLSTALLPDQGEDQPRRCRRHQEAACCCRCRSRNQVTRFTLLENQGPTLPYWRGGLSCL